jgi:hypothetical protein
VHNLASNPKHRQVLENLRALVDTFVTENDQRVISEDPVDIYRGFYGPNTI